MPPFTGSRSARRKWALPQCVKRDIRYHLALTTFAPKAYQQIESEAQIFALSQESKPEPSTWLAGTVPLNHRLLLVNCEL